MAAGPSGSEVSGLIVGAVVLFCLISLLPILLAWRHRRHRAREEQTQRSNGSQNYCHYNRADYHNSSMQQANLEDWLQHRNPPGSVEQYMNDKCPICLSTLALRSSQESLAVPEPIHIAKSEDYDDTTAAAALRGQRQAACRSSPRTLVVERSQETTVNRRIGILKPCNHVFHTSCLASWFGYGNWTCPVCKAPYVPCSPVV